jgi:acetoacetyl-CoA synthetase
LPSLHGVIRLDDGVLPKKTGQPAIYALDELIQEVPVGDAGRFVWRHFPFNHPLFIMFSSGTTGKPKCIMHGAGGSLLEHLKEHRLHTDLRPGDRMYFHTSCAWMMWNWQLSALASGVEIVTYDGPLSTVDKLWSLVAEERVTVFGTSPAYLKMCEDAGLMPGRQLDLGALRTVLSTGAVLHDAQFNWVRDHVRPIPVQSISGGTDILGCFVLGNPRLAVYAGEAQCRSLALDVQAWGQNGRTDGIGELVCTNPFPSRPLGFFGDTDGTAFHAAYFAQNPGCWTHGDLIEFSPQGSARLHGRSDGVLNVRGINVAPGDIYRVLRDVPEVREAMVVEQRARAAPANHHQNHPDRPPPEHFDQRVVLLLVLRHDAVLNGVLMARVLGDIARRLSPAHVPERIIAVDELPVTHNGKLSEAAARSAVNGLPIGNATALRNPGCLEAIRNHPALHLESRALPEVGHSRKQLELHLKAQWENLFGFTPVGLNDNFFELGGNSLLGARFLAAVRHSTGRALPLASLLMAPTIQRMAALIAEGTQLPASPGPVLIRPGTGRPIFLVHGLSGSVMECWALVGALQSARPVYGLQAQGLDGEQPPQERVEDIAGSYIEQMFTVQRSGPYAVVGYSFGGLVALEIAQQLLGAGEKTESLCLLDTYAQQDLPWSTRVRYHGVRAWRTLARLPAAQVPGFLTARLAQMAGLGPRSAGPAQNQFTGRPLAQLPAAQQLVYNTMVAALAAYRPQLYQGGPMLYVRAEIQLGNYFDPLLLWQSVASRGLVVVKVPDGHLDMVGPNAHLVAALIDRELDKAQ